MFDEAGFPDVRIVASNELDEYVIQSLRSEGSQIDIYGVGTKLATAGGEGGGALGGVYKLVRFADKPRLKVTQDIAKATLPDRKRLLRLVDAAGTFIQDVICREGENLEPGATVYDPTNPSQRRRLEKTFDVVEIRRVVMEKGQIVGDLPDLKTCADHCAEQFRRLPEGTLRLHNPHTYKISISPQLHELRERLMEKIVF